eukprot:TRINITY_DN2004_c0_g1_i2.p1 TRINITY_DN2004_c0_g1~~TRINITY_DN2004_c0_g1_i2.p1  ORF type:complete len:141 (+),score=31.37 TRINITY_DN2004_c0_g1_i2:99-521(+)
MGIVGIGTDIALLARFAPFAATHTAHTPTRLATKILHPSELLTLARVDSHHAVASFLAARWAAKEAIYKACCCVRGAGLLFPEIQILSEQGRPQVILHGSSKAHAEKMMIDRIHLSISHDGPYVLAFSIAEAQRKDANSS